MEGNPTITNLKDFVDFYGAFKSDVEMAKLLSISVQEVEITRMDENNLCKEKKKEILDLV